MIDGRRNVIFAACFSSATLAENAHANPAKNVQVLGIFFAFFADVLYKLDKHEHELSSRSLQ